MNFLKSAIPISQKHYIKENYSAWSKCSTYTLTGKLLTKFNMNLRQRFQQNVNQHRVKAKFLGFIRKQYLTVNWKRSCMVNLNGLECTRWPFFRSLIQGQQFSPVSSSRDSIRTFPRLIRYLVGLNESWTGFAPESRSFASCGSRSMQFTSLATDVKTGDLGKQSGGISLYRKRPTQRPNVESTYRFLGDWVLGSRYASRFGVLEFPRCNTLNFVGKYIRYAMGEIRKSGRECTDNLFR